MSCGISLAPMSLKDILETCVLYSFSQAWQLGRAIFRARNAHTSVVDAVVEHKGKVLLTGKVSLWQKEGSQTIIYILLLLLLLFQVIFIVLLYSLYVLVIAPFTVQYVF